MRLIQYSIIFIGGSAYVFPKNVNEKNFGITNDSIYVNNVKAVPTFKNVDLSRAITPNAYLNNWTPKPNTTTTTSWFPTTTTSTSSFSPQT